MARMQTLEIRTWHWLLGILLLVPVQLGAKGCDSAVVGDDTPDDTEVGGTSSLGTAAGAGGATTSTTRPIGTGGMKSSSTASTTVPNQDRTCGGLTGATCGANEYCNFSIAAQCGAADQTGICTAIPQICTAEYAPVCGCDGKTYGNRCEAAGRGVSVVDNGECAKDPTKGVECGGLTGGGCPDGQYCNYPISAQCGAADQTGECTTKPEACDLLYQPVCGCDGGTYGNDCAAATAGVSVAASGECAKEPATGASCGGLTGLKCAANQYCNYPISAQCGAADQTGTCAAKPSACTKEYRPVCGCDGKTYGNQCAAASAGISAASNAACADQPSTGADCGGIAALKCPVNQYCNYPISAQCGAADQTGTCAAKPEMCTMQYAPVCGCDGETYGNSCSAAAQGVSVAASGECL